MILAVGSEVLIRARGRQSSAGAPGTSSLGQDLVTGTGNLTQCFGRFINFFLSEPKPSLEQLAEGKCVLWLLFFLLKATWVCAAEVELVRSLFLGLKVSPESLSFVRAALPCFYFPSSPQLRYILESPPSPLGASLAPWVPHSCLHSCLPCPQPCSCCAIRLDVTVSPSFVPSLPTEAPVLLPTWRSVPACPVHHGAGVSPQGLGSDAGKSSLQSPVSDCNTRCYLSWHPPAEL